MTNRFNLNVKYMKGKVEESMVPSKYFGNKNSGSDRKILLYLNKNELGQDDLSLNSFQRSMHNS